MTNNSPKEITVKVDVEHNLESKNENELFKITFKAGDVSKTYEASTIQGILELIGAENQSNHSDLTNLILLEQSVLISSNFLVSSSQDFIDYAVNSYVNSLDGLAYFLLKTKHKEDTDRYLSFFKKANEQYPSVIEKFGNNIQKFIKEATL